MPSFMRCQAGCSSHVTGLPQRDETTSVQKRTSGSIIVDMHSPPLSLLPLPSAPFLSFPFPFPPYLSPPASPFPAPGIRAFHPAVDSGRLQPSRSRWRCGPTRYNSGPQALSALPPRPSALSPSLAPTSERRHFTITHTVIFVFRFRTTEIYCFIYQFTTSLCFVLCDFL